MRRLASAVLFVLLAVGASLVVAQAPVPRPMPPPAFVSVSGSPIPVGKNGVSELVFVARWCRSCEGDLAQLRRRLGVLQRTGYHVVVIGVPERQDQASFVEWAGSLGVRRQLVFDGDAVLAKAYGVSVLPWHVVVDSRGRIVYSSSSSPTLEALRAWLKP